MAAAAACVLVTAGLGWVTAVAVGLTGPTGEPVVDALPSVARQAGPSGPTFGRTLDLDGPHADRAHRATAATPTPSASPTSAAVPTSAPPTAPAPERSSTPTRDAVPVVQQGDPCRTAGAVAVTRSGTAAVCTAARGNSGLRWRHA